MTSLLIFLRKNEVIWWELPKSFSPKLLSISTQKNGDHVLQTTCSLSNEWYMLKKKFFRHQIGTLSYRGLYNFKIINSDTLWPQPPTLLAKFLRYSHYDGPPASQRHRSVCSFTLPVHPFPASHPLVLLHPLQLSAQSTTFSFTDLLHAVVPGTLFFLCLIPSLFSSFLV